MTYDIREAVRILERARAELGGVSTDQERAQAASALLQAVETAAKSAGFKVTERDGDLFVHLRLKPFPAANVTAQDGTVLVYRARETGDDDKLEPPSIEYDPVSKQWVGTEHSTEIAPVPGELIPMRSAVSAVADRIAEALRGD